MTELEAVTDTSPLPVLLAKIASPPLPRTAPVTTMVRSPVPAVSARIPLPEPVTEVAVIVKLVPLATVCLAKIP